MQRNKDIHGEEENNSTRVKEETFRTIQSLISQAEFLPEDERDVIFNDTLENRMKLPIQSLIDWIDIVKPTIEIWTQNLRDIMQEGPQTLASWIVEPMNPDAGEENPSTSDLSEAK